MKHLFAILLFALSLSADNIYISGVITESMVYDNVTVVMTGDVVVSSGVEISFIGGAKLASEGNYQFTVNGKLISTGSSELYNKFFSSTGEWKGIRFEDCTELSELKYTEITNAEDGLTIISSPVLVENCHFNNNIKGISLNGLGNPVPPTVEIKSTLIENCADNGIFIVEYSGALIQFCEIRYCAQSVNGKGAIQLSNQSADGENNVTIKNCEIHHNNWQGITAWDLTASNKIYITIEQNEIYNNLTGLYLIDTDGYVYGNHIFNNFVSGNPNSGAGVMVNGSNASPIFSWNLIEGNFTGFYLVGSVTPNLGDLENYTTMDDGYNDIIYNIDESGNEWSIYNYSTSDIKAENIWFGSTDPLHIASTIFDFNDDPSRGSVDFDPFRSESDVTENIATTTSIISNYPNPFNPSTEINYDLGKIIYNHAKMVIRNINGEKILEKTLSDKHGKFSFNGEKLSSGVYVLSISADGVIIQSRNMVLIK
ncbi:MAG: right-handed parallel beta-helix repeat-containing protein [Candidatus Delongbacteria bacterium]|nr:right-handed parallel beta-helix repeat-containing protein [Candidatus Delongbacteria bacterium]MBN2834874.1 right-handed parallel beta-helix repeat-containing protein [Candidatus Delongbacteria bacterium]